MTDEEAGRYGVGRLLTLSDGVFAIALTLLVLSVRVDLSVPALQLGDALRQQRPELVAYGLSVVVIGAFWIAHHRLYARVVRVDTRLLFDRPTAWRAAAGGLPIAVVFFASVPVAFWRPAAAQYMWFLAVPLRLSAARLARDRFAPRVRPD